MAKLGLTKELYFTTSTVIDWMDVFTRPAYKQIIVESLKYCQQQKGLEIYAWVLMTKYEKKLLSHCKCLYSERSDFKSDRAELMDEIQKAWEELK